MNLPSLQCAEKHPHYLPVPRDPRADEADRIAYEVNKLKVENPQQGSGVYESLVDQLIANQRAISTQPEYASEPMDWTAPQRVVWRSAVKLSESQRMVVIEDRNVMSDVKAFAVVNGGRWLVLCPFPNCNGAQYASFLDRRFYCVDCCNRAVGGKWLEVIWPAHAGDLERTLSERPGEAQHWVPGETSDDLREQDAEGWGLLMKDEPKQHSDIDTNSLPKEAMKPDGTMAPALHVGTPEWNAAQKDVS